MGSFRKGFGFAFGILMGGLAFLVFVGFAVGVLSTCGEPETVRSLLRSLF